MAWRKSERKMRGVILVGILFLQISLARSQQLPARSLPCSIRGVALVGGDLGDSDGGGGFAAEDAAECQGRDSIAPKVVDSHHTLVFRGYLKIQSGLFSQWALRIS